MPPPDAEALWAHVVAGAATPWERAAWPASPGPSAPDAAERRAGAWAAAVTGGDADALQRLFEWRGISPGTARDALRDVRPPGDGRLPPWAVEVRALVDTLLAPPADAPEPLRAAEVVGEEGARAAGADGSAEWSLHRVFAPLLALGARRLGTALAASPVAAAPAVNRTLLAQLARRMGMAAAHLFFHRVDAADLLDGHPGALGAPVAAAFFPPGGDVAAGWAALLTRYPVLARVLADVLAGWHAAAVELFQRLGSDHAALAEAFSPGAPLGRLEEVSADAGDVHDFGRTVAVLRFGGGVRVVYKPRDLRVAAAYMGLARALNDAGLSPPLATRAVLVRPGYAWEEHVRAGPCADEGQVERFYLRMGMLARLLQLTGAADFTTDNVLACGEHPQPVDLETLVAPLLSPPAPPSPAERAAEAVIAGLPLRSGLLTAPVFGEPGRPPADVGALAAGERRSPFRQTVVRRGEDGQARLQAEYAEFPGNSATPWLNGAPVRPSAHFAAVREGYRRMGLALRRVAAAWAAPGGPLGALAEAPVRFLARDTHIYTRILQESLQPRRLRDGVARELCLERLWRARFSHPGVVAAEIDALRRLDVPIFTALPGSSALALGEHGDAPAFFGTPPLHGVRERLASLARRAPADDDDAVHAALFVVEPGWRAPLPPAGAAPHEPWLEMATHAGDALLAAALPGTAAAPAWVGYEYLPAHDWWRIAPLGDDVLTGAAGLAIVLADLARHTGAGRYARAARAVLEGVAARIPASLAGRAAAPLYCGALHGWGSALHACLRGAAALDAPGLARRAAAAFAALSPETVVARAPADLPCGRLGLALTLAAAALATGDDGLARLATTLAAAGDAEPAGSFAPYPPAAWLERVVPMGQPSIAIARLRLADLGISLSPLPVGDDLDQANRGERGDANPGDGDPVGVNRDDVNPGDAKPAGARRDDANPGDANRNHAGRGDAGRGDAGRGDADRSPAASGRSAGSLLAELELARDDAARRDAFAAARAFADAARGGGPTALLDAAGVALAWHRRGGGDAALAQASDLGSRLAAHRRREGRWFADRLAPDRYMHSAVAGVGAIAHLFLALHAPGDVRSIRLAEP
ncbi:MAG TPA: type 2 lanthipeptide synthetase LanM [Longimicrobium sp.]|nr:type 2 lanthipeptide synthetase LanM [Longimicrobium sp.]